MNHTPKFFINLWGDLQGHIDRSIWGSVSDSWQAGRFQDSFNGLLDYINPALREKYGDATGTTFKVPHGSVVVDIAVKDSVVTVECPMVDITDATRVPLLRKVAELNFYPLNLAQMKLKENQLSFHFSSSLDTSEPYKMYDAFKEICKTADRYDDEFQEKFKTKNLVEPKVTYPSTEDIDKAWDCVNQIIDETFEYQTYFDAQRWQGSSLDFLIIAMKRIDLCSQPQGFFKTELEVAVGDLENGNINFNDRLQKGRKFLRGIQEAGKDAFVKNLYVAETFIPDKWSTAPDQTKQNTKGSFEQIQKYHNDKNYIASCIESLYVIYDLFYKNNMDVSINTIFIGALTATAGKSWEEASPILLNSFQTIQQSQFN